MKQKWVKIDDQGQDAKWTFFVDSALEGKKQKAAEVASQLFPLAFRYRLEGPIHFRGMNKWKRIERRRLKKLKQSEDKQNG